MTTSTKKFVQKKAPAGPPLCSGNKEVEMTLNERFQAEVTCSECGTRHVVDKIRKDDGNRFFFQIPPHKIPATLHELRKRLDQESDRAHRH